MALGCAPSGQDQADIGVGGTHSGEAVQEDVEAFGISVEATEIEDVVFLGKRGVETEGVDTGVDQVQVLMFDDLFDFSGGCGRDGEDVRLGAQNHRFEEADTVADQGELFGGVIS